MASIPLPPRWRELPTLRGQHVTLEPLQAAHAVGLRAALGDGALSRLWYTGVPAPAQVDDYVGAALAAQADGLVLPYVVRDAAGEVVGCTRYYGRGPKRGGFPRHPTRHADGTPRDTVVFSIIDTEWAGVKRHLQFRLEANA
ncbi:hypothetical protein G3N70_11990 [Xanthomonas hortorum pv. gardneri]|uniref:GNAT family N-acetyltransferase n=1 Tax=Xanthomonas hortorum TaxID=56454 RepID=UPI002FDF92B7